ncbi:MAG: MFS transporter, partial [Candidatus Cryptobacteroides sp.]
LILCVLYTFCTVKEMPPKEYAEFHGIRKSESAQKEGFVSLLLNAPKTFWTVGLVQFFCWAAFMYMWTYTNGAIAINAFGAPVDALGVPVTTSPEYQAAGNWVGVLFAVQAVGSLCWALFIPKFRTNRTAYIVSLLVGAAGFVSAAFLHNQYALFASYFLIGFAWAAMLSLPFTILTNSLSGDHIGTYLGLFNCTICLPQIVAAALGGLILKCVGGIQANMLVIAGVLLVAGAASVLLVREGRKE